MTFSILFTIVSMRHIFWSKVFGNRKKFRLNLKSPECMRYARLYFNNILGKKFEPFLMFSIYTNGMRLFSCQRSKSPDTIGCLNGIRVLTSVWVVFGHAHRYGFCFETVQAQTVNKKSSKIGKLKIYWSNKCAKKLFNIVSITEKKLHTFVPKFHFSFWF